MYAVIKHVHIACVLTSLGLFVTRGSLGLAGIAWRRQPLLRILPHIVDTLLLVSGLALAGMLAQYPFVNAWLTAKVLALPAYIILGALALRQGSHRSLQLAAMLSAVAVFGYIVSVALTHDPWGIFA